MFPLIIYNKEHSEASKCSSFRKLDIRTVNNEKSTPILVYEAKFNACGRVLWQLLSYCIH